ncbi:MAG: helix-turn-helix transcriptional regulator [Clostridia bacterium]|nr:helix-turn-helix transcriptional regulator [Clostridia bacterium]
MSNNIKLTENLKAYRRKLNLTQSDVAEIINKDRTSIAKYESGAAQPPFSVLRLMAKLYDVTIDELCGIAPTSPLVVRSDDKAQDPKSTIIEKCDKQEQLMILKFKLMDDDKKRDFMKILNEFLKD